MAAVSSFVCNQVGDSLFLLNTSAFADSISWILPDGTTSDASEVSIQLPAGENLVTLIAFNACGADTSQQVFPISSLSNPPLTDFRIFPNPADNYVIVSSDQAFQRLSLNDITGKIVRQENFPSAYLRRFFFSNLPAGTYILTMTMGGKRLSRQLMIR